VIGTPFFVVFGALSDKIGRKGIIMAGCLLAALTYFPIFKALTHYANPALEAAQEKAPVTVVADPSACSFQFNPVGTAQFTSSCDIAKSFLARNAVNYSNEPASAGTVAQVKIGDKVVASFDGAGLSKAEVAKKSAEFNKAATAAIREAGYPAKADPAGINYVMVTVLLTVLVIFVTMVYGPDRGDAGRDVPDAHPLHVDVAAVSHRQRLVRRASCRPRRSRSSRPPATSTTACGTRSSSR
jgi:hypothetical protein